MTQNKDNRYDIFCFIIYKDNQPFPTVTRSNTTYAFDQDDERRRREELAYKYVSI